jgi:hypothetical protein
LNIRSSRIQSSNRYTPSSHRSQRKSH